MQWSKSSLKYIEFKVDEYGTEMTLVAASASAPVTGGEFTPPQIFFTADHPFIYFVADKNGNLFFLGTVVDNFQS